MNIDSAFLAGLLKSSIADIQQAKSAGISPSDFMEAPYAEAMEFIYMYVAEYGELPSKEVVVDRISIELDEVPASIQFLIDEMLNKKLFRHLQDGMTKASELLKKNKPRDTFAALDLTIKEARSLSSSAHPSESLFLTGPKVIQFYEDIKNGKKGILTRWPSLNDCSMGFWPQDLVLFVARTATGKTWVSIIIALDAWMGQFNIWDGNKMRLVQEERAKKRVLYVTTEVAQIAVAGRFYCVKYKIPYGLFRSGKLSESQESSLRLGVEELFHEEGLRIVSAGFDGSVAGLEGAMDETDPHLVVIDGVYLLRGEGTGRTEQAANVYNDLKRMFQRRDVAGVVTTQLNRQANPNAKTTVSTETIALTDVAGWNTDMAAALIQTEQLRAQKRMIMKPIKVREGFGNEIELNWDFEQMNFNELPSADRISDPFAAPPSDSDESGLGHGPNF